MKKRGGKSFAGSCVLEPEIRLPAELKATVMDCRCLFGLCTFLASILPSQLSFGRRFNGVFLS